MAGQPRRLIAARFCRRTPSEGGRGVTAASQSTAACRMSMSMMSRQRHWPLPNPAPRFSFKALAVCCVRLDRGAYPERRNPSVVERAGRPQRWITPLQGQAPSGSQGPVATKHRSPARPHDASRSPLGSGGTGGSISRVSGAGIDWGVIPASPAVLPALVAGIDVLNPALQEGRRRWSGRARP